MKNRNSSSKKKKPELAQQKTIEQTMTPRVKKSFSVTKTNYMQLQLDTSSKKREHLEKNLAGKDKRINELERELKEFQDAIADASEKIKDYKGRYEQERYKNQRIQIELKQAVNLCKNMNQKCQELYSKNQALENSQRENKKRIQHQEKRFKELKELRRREKKQIKELIMNLLPMLSGQSSQSGWDSEINKEAFEDALIITFFILAKCQLDGSSMIGRLYFHFSALMALFGVAE